MRVVALDRADGRKDGDGALALASDVDDLAVETRPVRMET